MHYGCGRPIAQGASWDWCSPIPAATSKACKHLGAILRPLQLACAISTIGSDGKDRAQIWNAHAPPRRGEPIHRAPGMDAETRTGRDGPPSIRMTYDLYGHLFEDREADREAMKKIEAGIAAA